MKKPIVLEPEQTDSAVIWLHGLGADGADLVPIAQQLELPRTRFIFPHAPVRPVSINQGYAMPAWYDIYSLDIDAQIDLTGIEQSVHQIKALINEQSDLEPHRLFIAGFSQGGLIALATALSLDHCIGGVIALSTYLPAAIPIAEEPKLQVLQAHGRLDSVVPYAIGLQARQRLIAWGHEVHWLEYEMDHQVCAAEIQAIQQWLQSALA